MISDCLDNASRVIAKIKVNYSCCIAAMFQLIHMACTVRTFPTVLQLKVKFTWLDSRHCSTSNDVWFILQILVGFRNHFINYPATG